MLPVTKAPRRYLQLDVFADRPGAGNPLAVVLDAEAGGQIGARAGSGQGRRSLDEVTMQAFAAWTNLSETIFLLPPTAPSADYRVRIFTPRQELPFAGHPSVGAAWAALDSGRVDAGKATLVQECAAGLLPVRIETRAGEGGEGERIVHVRAPRARKVADADAHAALVDAALHGLPRGALPPALWDNGPRWWLAELADADAVRSMQSDLFAIATLTRSTGAVGLAVHARDLRDGHHLAVRAFCPADNIPEDPVTGSAQASIAARLAAARQLPGEHGRYVGSQGRELGRDGRVEVQVDDNGDVWIGGRVQAVIRGTVEW